MFEVIRADLRERQAANLIKMDFGRRRVSRRTRQDGVGELSSLLI